MTIQNQDEVDKAEQVVDQQQQVQEEQEEIEEQKEKEEQATDTTKVTDFGGEAVKQQEDLEQNKEPSTTPIQDKDNTNTASETLIKSGHQDSASEMSTDDSANGTNDNDSTAKPKQQVNDTTASNTKTSSENRASRSITPLRRAHRLRQCLHPGQLDPEQLSSQLVSSLTQKKNTQHDPAAPNSTAAGTPNTATARQSTQDTANHKQNKGPMRKLRNKFHLHREGGVKDIQDSNSSQGQMQQQLSDHSLDAGISLSSSASSLPRFFHQQHHRHEDQDKPTRSSISFLPHLRHKEHDQHNITTGALRSIKSDSTLSQKQNHDPKQQQQHNSQFIPPANDIKDADPKTHETADSSLFNNNSETSLEIPPLSTQQSQQSLATTSSGGASQTSETLDNSESSLRHHQSLPPSLQNWVDDDEDDNTFENQNKTRHDSLVLRHGNNSNHNALRSVLKNRLPSPPAKGNGGGGFFQRATRGRKDKLSSQSPTRTPETNSTGTNSTSTTPQHHNRFPFPGRLRHKHSDVSEEATAASPHHQHRFRLHNRKNSNSSQQLQRKNSGSDNNEDEMSQLTVSTTATTSAAAPTTLSPGPRLKLPGRLRQKLSQEIKDHVARKRDLSLQEQDQPQSSQSQQPQRLKLAGRLRKKLSQEIEEYSLNRRASRERRKLAHQNTRVKFQETSAASSSLSRELHTQQGSRSLAMYDSDTETGGGGSDDAGNVKKRDKAKPEQDKLNRRYSWDGTLNNPSSVTLETETVTTESTVASSVAPLPTCGVHPAPVKDGVAVGSHGEKKKLRVKPFNCFPEKVYMTEEEIYKDTMKPSENVEHLESFVKPWRRRAPKTTVTDMERELWGSPETDDRIGSLRVEVLGCVGLAKSNPDVGVYLICGDAAFATDVIPAVRSPMWPSQSKRAAVFPLYHAYLRLYVGVFDIVRLRSMENNDDFCGRVMVDVPSLRPNTEYDVTLPLRYSSYIYDRHARGVIRLRLSLHWFSERAAILSYWHPPKSRVCLLGSSNSGDKVLRDLPTISCADPKTFRNVAVTVHGNDLPGKYSRKAFQATMREFNLYRINIMFLFKVLLIDAIMYEKPFMSVYILFGWMHCVYLSSVRFVPAYIVGFLILQLIENYLQYNQNETRHLGYKPVSFGEIVQALFSDGKKAQIEPLLTTKKVMESVADQKDSHMNYTMNHREFPFSERIEYPKLIVSDGVVRRHHNNLKKEKEDLLVAGRLSVYVRPGQLSRDPFNRERTVSSITEGGDEDSEEEEEVQDLDLDDFSIATTQDDTDDLITVGGDSAKHSSTSFWDCKTRRIPLGPPQNRYKKGSGVPPQVHLARMEENLNKWTNSICMNRVYAKTLAFRPDADCDAEPNSKETGKNGSGDSNANSTATPPGRRKRKVPLDEFDKRLGIRSRHPNPVLDITGSFMGPVIGFFRIICVIVRILFNVSVWKDPYLTFWVSLALSLLLFILIVFPWRLFFFLTGIAAFGPQNIFVKKHLLYREQKRLEKESESLDASVHDGKKEGPHSRPEKRQKQLPPLSEEFSVSGGSNHEQDAGLKRGTPRRRMNPIANFRERRQRRRQQFQRRGDSDISNSSHGSDNCSDSRNYRAPFSASHHASPSLQLRTKPLKPREVVVPYSQFHKERFFDWPPDPSVARATPVNYGDCVMDLNFHAMEIQLPPKNEMSPTSFPALRRRKPESNS